LGLETRNGTARKFTKEANDMKKLLIVLAVVLAAASVISAADGFVVDDGAKVQATCGGWWYTYNDASSGGNSEVTPLPGKFEKEGKSARIKGKAGNKLGWDFIGLGVTLGEDAGCPGGSKPVDISKYSTLTFKIKGELSGGRFTVIIPYFENTCVNDTVKSMTEWADYEVGISPKVGKEWTTVKLDLRKDFKQPKWAKKAVAIEDVLKNAHNLSWHFSSPDGDTIDVSIEGVELN
jgi:hypothetical protein